MNKDEILNEFDTASSEFLQALNNFTQHNINTVPFEGSWTAGQVADHILKSATGAEQALTGPVKPTERDTDQHVALLRKIFLDFDMKMKSPDFVLPSGGPFEKDAIVKQLTDTFTIIHAAIEKNDLQLTCTLFNLPTLGELTGVEMTQFITVHTKRHAHQLRNIAKALA